MDGQGPARKELPDGGGLERVVAELRQWHVFRVAAAYTVFAWLLVQVVATIGPAFDLPNWVLRAVVLASIAGFLATMAFMLFRPRLAGNGRMPKYLSRRTRLVAGAAVLLIAAGAAFFTIRSVGAPQQVSLAVLPFADLSPARDKAYFAEGIAEEILSTLAAERGIKVLGRTSARQIERNPDPQAVRASLGVTHLLEGSTRTAGQKLRVNVRLLDTSDGSQVWEEEYDGALADVFTVQDKIAGAVVKRLRGTLLSGQVREAEATAIDAYQAYLAARALIRENKHPSILKAWQTARQLVQEHPDYAPGRAIFAETTLLLSDAYYGYGDTPVLKARALARPHAITAIRLAPDRAEGYAAMGLALPPQQAIPYFNKALVLDPSRTDVRLRLALVYDELKRPDAAFEQYRAAYEIDPLAPAIINRYIQVLGSSGRFNEAMAVIDQFVRRSGLDAQGWRFRGAIHAYRADLSRAIAARQQAIRIDPSLPYQHEWVAQYLHLLGLNDRLGPYTVRIPPFIRDFVNDDRGALRSRLMQQGAAAWDESGAQFAVFSLARSRDWETLVALYDRRPTDHRNVCERRLWATAWFIDALRQTGRAKEASSLLQCAQRQVNALLAMRHRAPEDAPGELEMLQASIMALRGDTRAFEWLEKAVHRGWLGQYYSSRLADWPQFDAYRADPRYAAIQKRIDAVIARERAETLAGK